MPNLDPHMAAEAVTRAEHPTSHDHDTEPPRSWGLTQVIVFIVVAVVLVACVWNMYSTI